MDAVFVPGVTKDELDMEAVRRYMRRSVSKGRRVYGENDDLWEVLVKLEWVKSESEITRAGQPGSGADASAKRRCGQEEFLWNN